MSGNKRRSSTSIHPPSPHPSISPSPPALDAPGTLQEPNAGRVGGWDWFSPPHGTPEFTGSGNSPPGGLMCPRVQGTQVQRAAAGHLGVQELASERLNDHPECSFREKTITSASVVASCLSSPGQGRLANNFVFFDSPH